MPVFLKGIGTYLPTRVVSNQAISIHAGVSADWILNKTGLRSRYQAAPGDSTKQMAALVAREALVQARLEVEEVELVVCASTIHDCSPVSSNAEDLAAQLGLGRARTIDISTPFSGFLTGLELAQRAVEAEGLPAALVVGVEGFGEGKRLRDRRTCYLFSDGAGALVLSPSDGFARLEGVRRGAIVQAASRSADDLGHLAWYGGRQPGFEGSVRAALDGLLDNVGGGGVQVITQRVGAPLVDLPPGVQVANPFHETGHFLSAALPLVLQHQLREGALSPGDRGLLLAMNAHGAWSSCTLELLRPPTWPHAPPSSPVGTADEEEAVPVLGEEELEGRIIGAVERFPSHLGNLIGLGLRLGFGSSVDARSQEQAEQEATLLLKRHTRRTDSLFHLRGSSSFAILLRYVQLEDADRLGDRLRQQLESLDLAGEMHLDVTVQITICGDKNPTTFAREMLAKLGPS